jgi:hypothetical protein
MGRLHVLGEVLATAHGPPEAVPSYLQRCIMAHNSTRDKHTNTDTEFSIHYPHLATALFTPHESYIGTVQVGAVGPSHIVPHVCPRPPLRSVSAQHGIILWAGP